MDIYICKFSDQGVTIELDGSVKRMARSKNNKILKGTIKG
jgi:hypothetical protein